MSYYKYFWLQQYSDSLDLDIHILQENLSKQKYEYIDISELSDRIDSNSLEELKDIVPVGDLDFVELFLSKVYSINKMNPIEIPDILRSDEFLKRKYSIVTKENLPKDGYYFVKYVSRLKQFSYTGFIERLHNSPDANSFLKPGLYQVSEVIDIISEYRCFVHNDQIVGIHYYDGKSDIFPDINLIKVAIARYSTQDYCPRSYTIDIAITRHKDTCILEVHPWVSVGLYGYMFECWLPYCYSGGFDWYVNCNKELTTFSNF